MKNLLLRNIVSVMTVVFISTVSAKSQFDINGQLVQRAEYRHGYGKLISESTEPAAFISQRVRLQLNYTMSNIRFFGSVQDVRTWGSTPQANSTDGFLSLHEGFAEISIDSFCFLKVGRQELNYDNARFLGSADWAMQARSHDFGLFKYEEANTKLHIGFGYNQNAENLTENTYLIANQYKTAQMIWYDYKKSGFEMSALFWNNGKEGLTLDSTGKTIDHNIRMSQTLGISNIKYSFWENNVFSGYAYYQFGKDVTNKTLRAYDVSLQTDQTVTINQTANMLLTLGAELISGTAPNATDNRNASFSPMYGTNHALNGTMDYFYVGGRFENSTGLNDLYFKMRYNEGKKWFLSSHLHYFMANASVYKANQLLESNLGVEIDVTGGVVISDECSLQLGYSQMLASETLKALQSSNPSSNQNWAFVMLSIRPKAKRI